MTSSPLALFLELFFKAMPLAALNGFSAATTSGSLGFGGERQPTLGLSPGPTALSKLRIVARDGSSLLYFLPDRHGAVRVLDASLDGGCAPTHTFHTRCAGTECCLGNKLWLSSLLQFQRKGGNFFCFTTGYDNDIHSSHSLCAVLFLDRK